MVKRMGEIKMKKNLEKVLYVLLIIIVTTSSILCLKGSISFINEKKVNIEEKSNVDYTVYLKENDYLGESLPAGKQYIASLIDYIDNKFNYTFQADQTLFNDYSYNITADLVAHEKDDESRILYEKEYELKPTQSFTTEGSSFSISDNIKLDYDYYNQIIAGFKSEYALSLDSYVKVKLNITINSTYEGFNNPIVKNETLEVKIPLTEQTIKVGMEYKDINQASEVEEERELEITNIVFFFFFWASVLLDVFVVLALVRCIEQEKKDKGRYQVELEKIQKHYDRAIVESSVLPNEEGKQVIEVERFEELLDARENVEKPILHYKGVNESIFSIVDGDIVYKYILRG